MLGELVALFPWFGFFYIMYAFVAIPALLWAISYMYALGTGALVLGILLDIIIVGASFMLFYHFQVIANHVLAGASAASNATASPRSDLEHPTVSVEAVEVEMMANK